MLTGRHRPLRLPGTRRLHLGDGCALGTIDAYAGAGHTAVVEVPSEAVRPLAGRRPHHFVPAEGAPGDALQAWLEQAAADGGLAGIDGALLLGHAQSIQRRRRTLIDHEVLPRRAITTRPYWATGKQGL